MYQEILPFIPMDTDKSHKVVQANKMILGRQNLTLNEAKLIRLAIMQILADDNEFKPYTISPKELAKAVGCDDSNFYRSAHDLCQSVSGKTLGIYSDNGSYLFMPWVAMCEYNADTNLIQIRLNDMLKPYLLNLRGSGCYTQYNLEMALRFKSINTIRLWELLIEESHRKVDEWPLNGITVELSLDTIRDVLMLYKHKTNRIKKIVGGVEKIVEEKSADYEMDVNGKMIPIYTQLAHMKQRVIDKALEEIMYTNQYSITYEDIKEGRNVVGFRFHMNYKFHERMIAEGKSY